MISFRPFSFALSAQGMILERNSNKFFYNMITEVGIG